jgi:hypothetical protein
MIVQVLAHRPTTERNDVRDSLNGELAPFFDLVEYDLRRVSTIDAATGERRLTLNVPIEEFANASALDFPDAGVYPITVRIRRDREPVATAITFLERVRTDGITRGPLSLSLLGGIDEVDTFPTETELASAHEQLAQAAELAERVSVPLTLRLPAQLVDAVLADDEQLAARLREALAGDTLIATTDLPLDASSATEAGIEDEFVRRLRDGEATLVSQLGASTQRTAWLMDVPVTRSGAATLRDLGVQLLVTSFDDFSRLERNPRAPTDSTLLQSAALPDQSAMAIAVIDPAMSLVDPDLDFDTTPAERAVQLMAEIGTVRNTQTPDRRSLVIATPRLAIPDPDVVQYLEQFANEQDEVAFEPLSALPGITNTSFLDGEAVTVQLGDEPPVDLTDRAADVDAARFRLADVSTMLPLDDPRPAAWDSQLRTALTTGLRPAGADALITGVEREIDSVRAAVVAPEPFSFTVGGREASIPLRIGNTSSTPVTIEVHLESDKLAFPENDFVHELPPNATSEIQVDIVARSNGVSPMTVSLRTPFGSTLTDPVVLTARVNNLTGLGRVVTVGLLLVLATWWMSYFMRRRRKLREQRVTDSISRHPATVTSSSDPAD